MTPECNWGDVASNLKQEKGRITISTNAALQKLNRSIVNVEYRTALQVLQDLVESFDYDIILAALFAMREMGIR